MRMQMSEKMRNICGCGYPTHPYFLVPDIEKFLKIYKWGGIHQSIIKSPLSPMGNNLPSYAPGLKYTNQISLKGVDVFGPLAVPIIPLHVSVFHPAIFFPSN